MTEPQNLTRKPLADHFPADGLILGEEVDLAAADRILTEDATGPMTALQFEALDMDRHRLEVSPRPGFMPLLRTPTAGYPAIAAHLPVRRATPTNGGADELGQVAPSSSQQNHRRSAA